MPVRASVSPMLATPAATLPSGPQWTYEVKWDGYRALAVKRGSRVQLLSRNQKDLTRDYPAVVAAVAALPIERAILDGEIVALDAGGRPSFQALQHRATDGHAVVFYAFDLLDADGVSYVKRPLAERREALAATVRGSAVLLSEPLPGDVVTIEQTIRAHRLEGVVAKRADSIYRPGERTDAWIKVKFSPVQEFVVGGYKPSGGSFDSILVGYYEDDGRLLFAGKVRAGFTPHTKQLVFERIVRHTRVRCPFANLPNSTGRSRWGEGVTADDMPALTWVTPRLVVQVSFVEWTRGGALRHATFAGLRTDKAARDVRRE